MLAKREDSSGICIGDEFLCFSGFGNVFITGEVDEITQTEIYVDFGDNRVRYDRASVVLVEEHRGFIHEYYTSTRNGEEVERFR